MIILNLSEIAVPIGNRCLSFLRPRRVFYLVFPQYLWSSAAALPVYSGIRLGGCPGIPARDAEFQPGLEISVGQCLRHGNAWFPGCPMADCRFAAFVFSALPRRFEILRGQWVAPEAFPGSRILDRPLGQLGIRRGFPNRGSVYQWT